MMSYQKFHKENFISWLSKRVSPAQLSELYMDYQRIDEFCAKHKVLNCSLLNITNLDEIKRVQRFICTNKLFRLKYRNSINRINVALKHYIDFVNEETQTKVTNSEDESEKTEDSKQIEVEKTIASSDFSEKACSAKPSFNRDSKYKEQYPLIYAKVYESLKATSDIVGFRGATLLSIYENTKKIASCETIKEILDNVSWAKCKEKKYFFMPPESESEMSDIQQANTEMIRGLISTDTNSEESTVKSADNYYTIDFKNISDLPYTRPVRATYFEQELEKVTSWKQLYLSFFKKLYEDYRSVIPMNKSFGTINGRMDLCTIELIENMVSPVEIETDIYIETNLSATDIVRKIKKLLDICLVDYSNVTIIYEKKLSAKAYANESDCIAELDKQKAQRTSDTELKAQNTMLYHKLYSVSKVFDDPEGLTVDRILTMIGSICSKDELIEYLNILSWATKLSDEVYTFAKSISRIAPIPDKKDLQEIDVEPTDFDKNKFIRVLMSRYQSGMQFDSIDLENFRDTYEDMCNEKLEFTDEELEVRLRYCGIIYKDRLFPAEGIIDNATKERLFAYIENKFAAGNKVLYYKAIFSDLSDAFAYCFSLTDEHMLKAYIEHTAEKGKYYFYSNFMSIEKNVEVDHSAEIEDFLLAAGKPLSYDEVYEGLSHISKDIIYHEIRIGSKFLMNEKEHYFHIDIFEFSDSDGDRIAEILNKEIEENGYAIWSKVFDRVKEQMPIFIENNLYLSPLGIRNALSRFMAERFDFDGEVISAYGSGLGMADVFRLYAKHNTPFSDTDLYNFSKATDTTIYFGALAEESVRVSKNLFIAKDQIEFDIEATDKALETYLSSGYILIKDVDSFLVFPNVGYEWNEFLLESYLLHYSKKFCLVNNGTSLNNVAGAVTKKDGEFTQFVDICAQALADSGIELKKTVALNYLAEINLITRRSYKELDIAMTKARQIRNQKG